MEAYRRIVSVLVVSAFAAGGCMANISSLEQEQTGFDSPDAAGDEDPEIAAVDAGVPDAVPVDIDAAPPRPCSEGDAQLTDDGTGDCYFIVYAKTTRALAAQACAESDAHLVSIESAEENSIALKLASGGSTLLTPDGDDYWTGGTDQAAEGTWLWDNGDPVVFVGWRQLEPNNGLNEIAENCMILEGDTLTWDDRDCAKEFGYVCEREAEVAP